MLLSTRAKALGKAGRNLLGRARARRVLRVIFWLAGAGVCTFSLGFASVFVYLDPRIPSIETYRDYRYETPLRIYTADSALIGEFGRRLIPIALADVPEHFLNGLIDTEDKRFYWHFGIDLLSLANDVVSLATSDVRTGASTITMQLAKVVSFDREQLFIRKFKEMLTALKIERDLTKAQILELYVNIMSFGKNAYGVQAAANTYYGKPAAELDLAQLAMLAGILKKPEGGNPINGPEWAVKRRNLVLRRMLSQGSIGRAEYEAAVAAPITAKVFQRGIDLPASYPAEWVRVELFKEHGRDIYTGFDVYTTLDSKLQAEAQRALREGLLAYDRRHGYRGPAGRADLASVAPLGDAPTRETPLAATIDQEALTAALADFPASGDLQAGVVLRVRGWEAVVVRRGGQLATLGEEALRWARPFLGTDSLGPVPKEAADVVSPGDVVYLRPGASGWRLAQLPDVQGALVALDSHSGAVRAMVGGWDFNAKQFNHALQARRQPGSSFKPFVYSAALASGVTPATIYWDVPRVFQDANLETEYRPRNEGGFEGKMPLRRGLYKSKNSISIGVLLDVGVERTVDHVTKFGFAADKLPRNTQLAIGGGKMLFTPLEMAAGYAIIANGGYRVAPHIVDRVQKQDGTLVSAPVRPVVCDPCPASSADTAPLPERVLDARNAFIMRSMLGDVVRLGTGRRAGQQLGRSDLGGKTGTTDDATDTWFNGFHPKLVATTWVGFSDGRSTGKNEFGSKAPLAIWTDFMRAALEDLPVASPNIPEGVVSVKVNPDTGRVASPGDPDAVFEYFLEEHMPESSQPASPTRRPGDTRPARPEDVF